ncbi:MAG: universal stress protein [Dehalococcoidia bacterium]|nr:universal stress protein [Dehalococcoidia bacterium]
MFQKILVPLDGTPYSEAVLQPVTRMAAGTKATVVLLRVGEPPKEVIVEQGRVIPLDEQIGWSEAEFERYLGEKAKQLRSQGVTVDTATAYGLPEEEIVRYAEEQNVDVIVVASHGKLCIGPVCFSHDADKITTHSTKPVLLVKIPEGAVAKA